MELIRVEDDRDECEFVRWLEKELRSRARRLLGNAPPGTTLQPTSLVNEAWIAIASHAAYRARDRDQFLHMMPRVLRSIVVDHARARASRKRGGGWGRVSLGIAEPSCEFDAAHILDLHDAISALAKEHPRVGRIFEARFFGGQSRREVSTSLGITLRSVDRDLMLGRAWLSRYLGQRHETER